MAKRKMTAKTKQKIKEYMDLYEDNNFSGLFEDIIQKQDLKLAVDLDRFIVCECNIDWESYTKSTIATYQKQISYQGTDFQIINLLIPFIAKEYWWIYYYVKGKNIIKNQPIPQIVISEEIVEDTFGKYNDEEVIKKIQDTGDKLSDDDHKKGYTEVKRYIETRGDSKWESIKKIIDEYKLSDDKDLIPILRRRKCKMKRFGDYNISENIITIYYNAISEYYKFMSEDFYSAVSMVLAHEYFHAVHYHINSSPMLWSLEGHESLIEPFAEYFCVLWCKENSKRLGFKKISKERYNSWEEYIYTSWAYAKALYLLKNKNYKDIKQNNPIFDISLKMVCELVD